jgi:hypothetical protein
MNEVVAGQVSSKQGAFELEHDNLSFDEEVENTDEIGRRALCCEESYDESKNVARTGTIFFMGGGTGTLLSIYVNEVAAKVTQSSHPIFVILFGLALFSIAASLAFYSIGVFDCCCKRDGGICGFSVHKR